MLLWERRFLFRCFFWVAGWCLVLMTLVYFGLTACCYSQRGRFWGGFRFLLNIRCLAQSHALAAQDLPVVNGKLRFQLVASLLTISCALLRKSCTRFPSPLPTREQRPTPSTKKTKTVRAKDLRGRPAGGEMEMALWGFAGSGLK